jgi:hypothetical protein
MPVFRLIVGVVLNLLIFYFAFEFSTDELQEKQGF